jgi:hypothetical protein
MTVAAIGWRAHGALLASGGRASVFAPLSRSFYAKAAGELVWVGPPGTPLHARAVIHSHPPAVPARGTVHIQIDGVTPWRPPALPVAARGIPDAARVLLERLPSVGEPRGLGRLLVSTATDDPILARARPRARAFIAACARDDPHAAARAARPLLGLGAGLTPSGDDYVGGALFGRRLLARHDAAAWDSAVAGLLTDAVTLTHAISVRLLTDLAAGEGWAPLHDLASALAAGSPSGAASAARAVTSLGHTSGWDLFAGFLAAVTG